jgi:macrolide transport system ATP-binding/permease protein
MNDLTFALRQLRKTPGFTAIAVLMLGLGIGANTAIFSFINAFFLKALAFRDPGRLVAVYTVDERNPGLLPTSHFNFRDYAEQNPVFGEMAEHTLVGVSLLLDQQPSQIGGEIASGNYFDLLGVTPVLGRAFYPSEYQHDGTHPVVVVSYSFWQTRLGGKPEVIGRPLVLNGTAFTIVGVAPPEFRGVDRLNSPNFWVPMSMHDVILTGIFRDFFTTRRALIMSIVARLKPGLTLQQADGALKPIAQKLAKEFPVENTGRSLRLMPLAEAAINPNQRQNFVLAGTLLLSLTAIVLLITCANLANLLLARAAGRQREIALRIALGADRRRVMRQLLTESLVLAALGGLAGCGIAYWTKDLLWALRPQGLPADFVVDLDAKVLGFAIGISLLTGVLFGLAPAWTSTKPDLVITLKEGSGGAGSRTPLLGFRNFLVAAQVSLSVVALVVAGLFIRSLQHAQRIDPGWNAHNLALLSFNLSSQGYDQTRGQEYFRRVIERAESIPGVTGASISTYQLLSGGGALRTVRPQGNDDKLRTLGRLMTYAVVTPEYHRFMGMPFVAGREFTASDDEHHPPVAIINQAFAQLAWPGENPLGKTMKLFNSETLLEVVGVLKNTLTNNLGEDPLPVLFLPMRQQYQSFAILHVRTAGDAGAMLPTLQKELQRLDPTLPFIRPTTMADNIDQALWGPRTGATLLSIFGLLALLLASLGVYAIMSYTVGQRTREIGIRMAIGAQAHDVLGMILGRGLIVAGAGLVLGLGVAFGVTRYFRDLLLGVSTADPVTYAVISGLLLFVAVLACWLPARRAARVNPLTALRTE